MKLKLKENISPQSEASGVQMVMGVPRFWRGVNIDFFPMSRRADDDDDDYNYY